MAGDISMQTRVSIAESMLSSNLGDEVVMMCIEQGKYYCLKGPSYRIWELLEQPTTVGEVCGTLLDEYDVAQDECETQLVSLITQMREKNIVVCSN